MKSLNSYCHSKAIITLFILVQFPVFTHAQVKQFAKLYWPEKKWVIFHPLIAKKSYRLTTVSLTKYQEALKLNKLDTFEDGGKIDALRHGLWMALLSQHIKKRKALSLGRAHEKSNYLAFKKGRLEDNSLPDKESCEMDIYNNCVGAQIGSQNKNVDLDILESIIISNIKEGKFVILKRNAEGSFVTCDNEVIIIKNKSWKSNKCLVSSSFNP